MIGRICKLLKIEFARLVNEPETKTQKVLARFQRQQFPQVDLKKISCPNEISLTFIGDLKASESYLQIVNGLNKRMKLLDFFNYHKIMFLVPALMGLK